MSSARPVYLLPDFYDYDSGGHLRRAATAGLSTASAYEGWWEPYHVMTYGVAVEETIAQRLRQRPNCALSGRDQSKVEVSDDLVLDEIVLRFQCPDRGEQRLVILAHRGHRTHLVRKTVLRALPK